MGNKFETITKNILYRVFFASFAALLVGIVFLNPYFDYKPYIAGCRCVVCNFCVYV